jgi:hypothetical protein
MASIRPVLDLAHDAHPVLLEGIVALDNRLQLESPRRVADLLAAQRVKSSIDVLLGSVGRYLLDPEKVLFVERAQALDPRLQFFEHDIELSSFHRTTLAAE